jgi:histidinol phosphatase-like enzyme
VGMWELFVKDHCLGTQPDIKASFFVGDAAGRPSDHGEGDLEFAQAVGLPFYLPEAAFSSSSSTTWPPLAVAEPQKEADVIVLDD